MNKAVPIWTIQVSSGCDECRCAGAVFAFFRDGIAHVFLPKQITSARGATITGAAVWHSRPGRQAPCIYWLRDDPAGRRRLRSLRREHHLRVVHNRATGERVFQVVPQVMYLDVDRLLSGFEGALASDVELQRNVVRNWKRIVARANHDANRRLTSTDFSYLLRGK